MTEKQIRDNWFSALEKEEYISGTIEWAFYMQDLIILGTIHKKGYFRAKIEDLLEDCNFHQLAMRFFENFHLLFSHGIS